MNRLRANIFYDYASVTQFNNNAIISSTGIELNLDFAILFVVTIILSLLIYMGKKNVIGKFEGLFLASLYFVYMAFVVLRG